MPSKVLSALKQDPRLRKWGLELLKRTKAKPYQQPNMEFIWDVWTGIASFHSVDRRQIGENNTGPYPYHEAIATDHKVLKFDDSRQGLPCNMTALRSILPQWNETLQLATVLRRQYVEYKGLAGAGFNLMDAYLYSKMGAALPAYLARRKQQPVADGELPVLETAFFTLGVGPFMVMRALMEKGDLRCLDPSPHNADAWYELADQSGSLITPKGYACAGSPKLIREFLDVVMNGSYTGPADNPHVERVFTTLGKFESFYRYTSSASTLELLVKIFHALTVQNLLALASDESGDPSLASASARQAVIEFLRKHGGVASVDREALSNYSNRVDILTAMIKNLGGDVLLGRLYAEGLLKLPPAPWTAQICTQRIGNISAMLGNAAVDCLREVHVHLGRPGWGHIEAKDLARRTFGNDLQTLFNTICKPPEHR